MARHLAAEDGVLVAHPRLEERVADTVHERSPAGAFDDVGDCPARPHVVEDRRFGLLVEHRLGKQCGHEVAVDERALLVDEEASVGVAVPCDPEVGALVDDLAHDELPVLRQQRVGLVIGEVAVGLEVGLDQVESEALEDRPDHRAGHAVSTVDHDLERLDHTGIDELQSGLVELVPDRDVLDAPAARGIAEPFLDPRLDVADAGVARQRDRPALDELGAGVALGIVRRGAHQPAVELPASRPGNRASRSPPRPRPARGRPRCTCRRDMRPPCPARSGACRARAPASAPMPACPPARRSPARMRVRSAGRRPRRSRFRGPRGCRRP